MARKRHKKQATPATHEAGSAAIGAHSPAISDRKLASRIFAYQSLPYVLLGVVVLVWLGPSLFWGQRLAFRDVSHFYLPLYEYLSERVFHGGLPGWNPLVLTGAPVIGDNTSAMFYPGRWLFYCGISTELAIVGYVLLHIAIAAINATYAASWAGVSQPIARLSGITFALSAPVIQQYCNLPFLVGAAWLPLALSGLIQCINIGSRRAIAIAATGLAFPILGGDPQTSFHGVLVAVCFWISLKIRARRTRSDSNKSDVKTESPPAKLMPLILATLLAFAATLVQIAPTVQWSRLSDRQGRTLPGISRELSPSNQDPVQAWYQKPSQRSFANQVYQYSTGPWNVAELLFPNLYGPHRPVNGRWSRLVNWEEHLWTTSVYAGLLTAMVLLLTLRQRQLNFWNLLAIIGFLLAMGRYGIVWYIQVIGGWLDQKWLLGIDPALGSLYWFLVVFIPGYATFRYPAKWLSFAVLGMAITLGIYLEKVDRKGMITAQRLSYAVAAIACSVFVLTWLPFFSQSFDQLASSPHRVTADQYYGVMDRKAAFWAIRFSALHTCVIAFLFARTFQPSTGETRLPSSLPSKLSVVIALDFLFAGAGWVTQLNPIRQPLIDLPEQEIRPLADQGIAQGFTVLRIMDTPRTHLPWMATSSENRSDEVEVNEQRTLYGLWNLPPRIAVVNSSATINPEVHASLWTATATALASDPIAARTNLPNLIRWLSVSQTLKYGPSSLEKFDTKLLHVTRPEWTSIPNPLPKVRWYAKWESLPRQGGSSLSAWEVMLPQIFADPAACPAWISPLGEIPRSSSPSSATATDAMVRVLDSQAESAEIEVKNEQSGWLYLQTLQDGNWRAEVTELPGARTRGMKGKGDAETIHHLVTTPVNLIGQGVYLPAGSWRVKFYYTTPWWLPASWGSLLAWLSIGFLLYRARQTSQQNKIAAAKT